MTGWSDLSKKPDWLKDAEPFGVPKLSDRDTACLVLPDLDYDAQLMAIHSLLRQHADADRASQEEIKRIEEFARQTSGCRNDHAVDEWIDRLHSSTYQDAAHSMAAVGMLAPFVESIFYQAFQGIRCQFYAKGTPPSENARWQQPAKDQWDCHFVWTNGRRSKNLPQGIIQLSEAVGLMPFLPSDLAPMLQVLFEYRNKMFHNGFEWPVEERERFERRIEQAGWPSEWFAKATTGGHPWVFYMTDQLIQHCLDMIEQIIAGIGRFCNDRCE